MCYFLTASPPRNYEEKTAGENPCRKSEIRLVAIKNMAVNNFLKLPVTSGGKISQKYAGNKNRDFIFVEDDGTKAKREGRPSSSSKWTITPRHRKRKYS